MIRGRDIFKIFNPIFTFFIILLKPFPLFFRKWLLVIFRNVKGLFGIGIRYVLLKSISKECGSNVSVHPNVYLFSPEKLSLGSNISIHPMCYIDAVGEVEIGDNVSIAHATTILSSTHIFSDLQKNIKDQGLELKKTTIENNVWLGAKSTILCGLLIREGSVIGANSVVTKNVNVNSIVVGSPGKLINNRRMKFDDKNT